MSLRAPDIADLWFQVGDHVRFTYMASSMRPPIPGGPVPREGMPRFFTAGEALSDEYEGFLTGSMVNGS